MIFIQTNLDVDIFFFYQLIPWEWNQMTKELLETGPGYITPLGKKKKRCAHHTQIKVSIQTLQIELFK